MRTGSGRALGSSPDHPLPEGLRPCSCLVHHLSKPRFSISSPHPAPSKSMLLLGTYDTQGMRSKVYGWEGVGETEAAERRKKPPEKIERRCPQLAVVLISGLCWPPTRGTYCWRGEMRAVPQGAGLRSREEGGGERRGGGWGHSLGGEVRLAYFALFKADMGSGALNQCFSDFRKDRLS